MKKYRLILFFGIIFLLNGCSQKPQDPYSSYRGSSSNKLFAQGEKNLSEGNYQEATEQFEALDALYPFGDNAEQAQLDIIYAYYKNDDIPSTIAAADRYIRLYPRGKNVDYAYYMRGVAGFDLGLSWLQKGVGISPGSRDMSTLQQSFSSFQTLTTRYPKSRYVPDAWVRMTYIRNLLAMREVDIAKSYVKRSAFVAAANRANYVVEHFQGTPAVPDALALMVEAYRKLGMKDMAADSYAILKKNYPKSRQLQRVTTT